MARDVWKRKRSSENFGLGREKIAIHVEPVVAF